MDQEQALNDTRTDKPLLDRVSHEPSHPQTLKLDNLNKIQVFGYSIGHFQNDLCAALWFNYLLYFLKNVVFRGTSDSDFYAGYIFL